MNKTIDFIGKRKIFFGISIAIMLIGIVCNIVFGTTLHIQFTGGAMLKYTYYGEIDQNQLESVVQDITEDQVTYAYSSDMMNNTATQDAYTVSIQFSGSEAIKTETQENITELLTSTFPDNSFTLMESSSVESSMGFKFLLKSLTAIAIAGILMVIYVAFRFRKIGGWSAGVMALVALLHDVLVIYFFYIVFKMPIDSNFIAVVLMILGYSLNDTIVIYDRVREERRVQGPKATCTQVFNVSCTKVIKRTIFTSLTTLIAIGTVLVVAIIFSLNSVRDFALPMMVGVVSGCYSTICIAGPLWVMWQEHKTAKLQKRK